MNVNGKTVKINVIGVILNNTGKDNFANLLVDEKGMPLEPAEALHALMMEYANVVNGGTSDMVGLPVASQVKRLSLRHAQQSDLQPVQAA